jgi:chromosome partitioning protein
MTAIKIAVGIQKGGVGKTTSTAAISESLALKNKKVLMVDFDPQSSLTDMYRVDSLNKSIAGILDGRIKSMAEIIQPVMEKVDIAPSHVLLAQSEMLLNAKMGADYILRKALATVLDDYDFIIIDMPPSLGKLTINGLTAADYIMIPVKPAALDMMGLRLYLETIDQIQEHTNPALKNLGIFQTVVAMHKNLHKEARGVLESADLPLIEVSIPDRIATAEAPQYAQSIMRYRPKSDTAKAYNLLTDYILEKTV